MKFPLILAVAVVFSAAVAAAQEKTANAAGKDPLDWWSLRPLQRPVVPAEGHPVDAFIREKLVAQSMAMSPEADARTLIRRVTYDLTGLPPTPEEVTEFLRECAQERPENSETKSPRLKVPKFSSAYERLVDRLLASPRYGERWARHWLDVVHYGDTHGYDKDQPRPHAWPYRDYVIRAFNEDKPYGRFVREQIAGDALYPNTADGILALGFIAAGPWDLIGHAELSESKTDGKIARLLDRDDMVTNTMLTFNAMTVQCARCHNHKFDPVSQEDYYGMTAVFSALDRADKPFDFDPAVAQQRAEWQGKLAALAAAKADLDTKNGGVAAGRAALLEQLAGDLRQGAAAPERAEFGYHSSIEPKQDAVKWVQVDLGASLSIARIKVAAAHDTFAGIGAGFGFPPRFKVELSNDGSFASGVTVLEDQTTADAPNPGIALRVVDAAGKNARFVRFTATRLAPRANDYIFALAELQVLDAAGRNAALGARVTALDSIEAPPRWRRANLVDGYYHGHTAETAPERMAALEKERQELLASSPADDPAVKKAAVQKELDTVKAALAQLPAPQVVYAGTVHSGSGNFAGTGGSGGKPRPVFVLRRGDVRQEGAAAGPGAVLVSRELPARFAVAPDQPESARRVALAEWLTDARHPLTWRVIVNRVWQYHFGRGLVDSPNDFGRMGQQPTHPELLDWLAVEFRDGGQSLKQLHRLILTSAAYRQSSAVIVSNELCAKTDRDNTLLWRMNRRKLEAEAVRDSILSVAGKLDLRMGGPGYQDFTVEKPEHSPHYQYQLSDPEDPATWRRSIYRFIVRSQTQPLLTVLDCADPSMSVDKRNETVNALQALALRNNQLTLGLARHFAERVASLASEPEAQITAAFRLALSREPLPGETAALVAFCQEHGLINTCRIILNLNEFAFVD